MGKENTQEFNNEVDETTDQQAPTGEQNEDSENLIEDNNESDTQDSAEFDYQAELERLQSENENYKKGLYAAKDKIKKLSREKREAEEHIDDPLYDDTEDDTTTLASIKAEALQAAREEIATFKKEIMLDTIDTHIEKLSSNESERQLIKYHYEHTINHSGYSKDAVSRDLDRARLLANEKRILREKDELMQSLKAKGSLSDSAVGSSQKHQETDMPRLSPEDLALLQRRGIDPKTVKFN